MWGLYASVFAPFNKGRLAMNNLLKGGIAGLAAWKRGGGIIGTILVFIVVFYLLGYL